MVRGVRVGARARRGERGEAEAEQGGRHAHSKVVPAGLLKEPLDSTTFTEVDDDVYYDFAHRVCRLAHGQPARRVMTALSLTHPLTMQPPLEPAAPESTKPESALGVRVPHSA